MKKPINLNEGNISIVELLEKEIRKRHTFTQSDIELFEQAKEMDKKQKEAFYKIGYLDGESKVRNFNENIYNDIYNKTFKSEIENQKYAEQLRIAEQLENEIDNL